MGLVAGTWGTSDLPRNLHNVGNTRKKGRDFSARGDVLAAPPAAAEAMYVLWGHSSAGTEPPQHLLAWGDNPQPLWALQEQTGGGNPPQQWESPGLWGWWLGGAVQGLQQMEGWPGDACPSVPAVSQPPAATQQLLLGPSPQPNATLGGVLSPVSSRCPSSPGPARPQLPGGMTLCPPAGPRSAGSHRPSRQRDTGRAGQGRERAGTGTGPWQGRG